MRSVCDFLVWDLGRYSGSITRSWQQTGLLRAWPLHVHVSSQHAVRTQPHDKYLTDTGGDDLATTAVMRRRVM